MVTPLIWRQGEISPPVLALRSVLASVVKGSGRTPLRNAARSTTRKLS
jgi:hypothetical protein